jgi:hypothetical protein
MKEQIINLKKIINTQSNKIDSLEKRIQILENNKTSFEAKSDTFNITDTLFYRLRNRRRRNRMGSISSYLNRRVLD